MNDETRSNTQRRYVEWCADVGRFRQRELVELGGGSQPSLSRIIRGQPSRLGVRTSALHALNALRKKHGLREVTLAEVCWVWTAE